MLGTIPITWKKIMCIKEAYRPRKDRKNENKRGTKSFTGKIEPRISRSLDKNYTNYTKHSFSRLTFHLQ